MSGRAGQIMASYTALKAEYDAALALPSAAGRAQALVAVLDKTEDAEIEAGRIKEEVEADLAAIEVLVDQLGDLVSEVSDRKTDAEIDAQDEDDSKRARGRLQTALARLEA